MFIRNRRHFGEGQDIIAYCCPKAEKPIKNTLKWTIGGLIATPFVSALICAQNASSECFSGSWVNISLPFCLATAGFWGLMTSFCKRSEDQMAIVPAQPPVVIKQITIHVQPSTPPTPAPALIAAAASSGLNLFPVKASTVSDAKDREQNLTAQQTLSASKLNQY